MVAAYRLHLTKKYHHHGGAGRQSSGMDFAFPAAPPREPLRKGLTESGVAGFNEIIQIDREKNIF